MNYPGLCAYCREGWLKPISNILRDNDVDILWKDGMLLRVAANERHAEVLNILINYYIEHLSADPESDTYLGAMSKLIAALDTAKQLSSSFTPEVTAIFNKYIPADYEEGSNDESDFVEDDAAIAEENIHEEVAEDYSSDELPRRVSDSSDGANLVDTPTIGDTLVLPDDDSA